MNEPKNASCTAAGAIACSKQARLLSEFLGNSVVNDKTELMGGMAKEGPPVPPNPTLAGPPYPLTKAEECLLLKGFSDEFIQEETLPYLGQRSLGKLQLFTKGEEQFLQDVLKDVQEEPLLPFSDGPGGEIQQPPFPGEAHALLGELMTEFAQESGRFLMGGGDSLNSSYQRSKNNTTEAVSAGKGKGVKITKPVSKEAEAAGSKDSGISSGKESGAQSSKSDGKLPKPATKQVEGGSYQRRAAEKQKAASEAHTPSSGNTSDASSRPSSSKTKSRKKSAPKGIKEDAVPQDPVDQQEENESSPAAAAHTVRSAPDTQNLFAGMDDEDTSEEDDDEDHEEQDDQEEQPQGSESEDEEESEDESELPPPPPTLGPDNKVINVGLSTYAMAGAGGARLVAMAGERGFYKARSFMLVQPPTREGSDAADMYPTPVVKAIYLTDEKPLVEGKHAKYGPVKTLRRLVGDQKYELKLVFDERLEFENPFNEELFSEIVSRTSKDVYGIYDLSKHAYPMFVTLNMCVDTHASGDCWHLAFLAMLRGYDDKELVFNGTLLGDGDNEAQLADGLGHTKFLSLANMLLNDERTNYRNEYKVICGPLTFTEAGRGSTKSKRLLSFIGTSFELFLKNGCQNERRIVYCDSLEEAFVVAPFYEVMSYDPYSMTEGEGTALKNVDKDLVDLSTAPLTSGINTVFNRVKNDGVNDQLYIRYVDRVSRLFKGLVFTINIQTNVNIITKAFKDLAHSAAARLEQDGLVGRGDLDGNFVKDADKSAAALKWLPIPGKKGAKLMFSVLKANDSIPTTLSPEQFAENLCTAVNPLFIAVKTAVKNLRARERAPRGISGLRRVRERANTRFDLEGGKTLDSTHARS